MLIGTIMPIDIIGWIAGILFAFCSFPQALLCYKQGQEEIINEMNDIASQTTRLMTKEDLKFFKYDAERKCDSCDAVGCYWTTDFWLCEKDILRMYIGVDE